MKKSFLPLLALVALASCTQNDMDLKGSDEQAEIKLSPIVGSIVQSRASYDETVPGTNSKNLDAKILITKSSTGDYSAFYNTESDRVVFSAATEFGFVDKTDGITAKPIYYPADDSNIYISGLYPYTADKIPADAAAPFTVWALSSTGNVSNAQMTFNGNQDLMVAYQVTSKKSSVTATTPVYPKMDFKHLLTKLIVKAKGDAAAVTAFGGITAIELIGVETKPATSANKNIKSTVKVFLNNSNTPIFSDPVEKLSFYKYNAAGDAQTEVEFKGLTGVDNVVAIPTEPAGKIIAYSMVPPIDNLVSDAVAYVLNIKTEKGAAAGFDVSVKLKKDSTTSFVGNTVSNTFTIILTFKATEITPVAGVGVWTPQGDTDIDIQ